MNEPSTYEKIFWRIFNFGAKLFAYGLVFVSLIFLLMVVATLIGKPIGAEYEIWNLVLLIPLLIVAILMIKANPYYPAKYRDWYEGRNRLSV